MENDSSLNNFNESDLVLVPIGAVAFAPFLLLELVAAIVSNAILLALVILACIKKLNNNINIYLFSLAIGGLIGAFELLSLTTLVIARTWVLGSVLCYATFFDLVSYNFIFVFIYLLLSRDKLKGVRDPLHGRPSNKKAYVNSAIVWIAVVIITIGFIISVRNIAHTNDEPNTVMLRTSHGDFICYGLTSRRANMGTRFIVLSMILITCWTVFLILTSATFTNFVRILVELRALRNLRLRFANDPERRTIQINGHDKPLYRTGEERTAKSLTLVFFIQFICAVASYTMILTQVIRNFVLPPDNEDGANIQIYFIAQLMIQFFPCINPILLILSNKRLRMRVKELFKCTLSPETENSPTHHLVKKPSITVHKTSKVAPLSMSEDKNIQLQSS